MALPSPYALTDKAAASSLKSVAPVRTPLGMEFIFYEIFIDGRREFISAGYPLKDFPFTYVFVDARRKERIRCYFTFESWLSQDCKVKRCLVALPRLRISDFKVRITLPGVKPSGSTYAVPTAVRKARSSVSALRQRKQASSGFRKSSSLRPTGETLFRSFDSITETKFGAGYSVNHAPSSYLCYRRDWTGVRTPGFGKLKKSQLPVNPHTVKITEIVDGYSSFQVAAPANPSFQNEFSKFTLHYLAPPDNSAHLADSELKALRNLIAKAELDIEANLAQDFAQIGQTVKLIGNTAKRLAKAALALKKGNIPGAIDALWSGHLPRFNGVGPSLSKSFASNWLELQYGWKPLLQDIYGTMNALKRLNSASALVVKRVTANGQAVKIIKIPIMHHVMTSSKAGEHSILVKTKCKFVLRYKIEDPFKSFLAQTGFTNPINLGWEILPLSFVVDWFLPIGPYLETLSSWDGVVFLDGSKVFHTVELAHSVINFSGTVVGSPTQFYETHAVYDRKVVSVDRSKLTALPTARFPTIVKNGLASTVHAQNALALLRSFFR